MYKKLLNTEKRSFAGILNQGFIMHFFIIAMSAILFLFPSLHSLPYKIVQVILFSALGCLSMVAVALLVTKKLNAELLVMLILLGGFVVRACYTFYTPINVRQHDFCWWGDKSAEFNTGHSLYIKHYIENFVPLKVWFWQAHHPPLYHFISGKIAGAGLALGFDFFDAFESLQVFGAGLSTMCTLVIYRILKHFNVQKVMLVVCTAIASFHGTFIVLAGSLNNDLLSIFFLLVACLYTLKWDREQSLKNIAIIAIAIGLGMMTKFTVALMAPITGFIFLKKLIQYAKQRNSWHIWNQFFLFLAICVPLGLWHPLYNLIQFGVAPGYVQAPGHDIFTGDHSLLSRMIGIPSNFFENLPYCVIDPKIDYNIWAYTLKCAMFGEFKFTAYTNIAIALVFINAAIILISLIFMVYTLLKSREKNTDKWFVFILWAVMIAAFCWFNYKLPYVCTLDYRYMVPTLLAGLAFIGLGGKHMQETAPGLWRPVSMVIIPLTAVFVILSVAFYSTAL